MFKPFLPFFVGFSFFEFECYDIAQIFSIEAAPGDSCLINYFGGFWGPIGHVNEQTQYFAISFEARFGYFKNACFFLIISNSVVGGRGPFESQKGIWFGCFWIGNLHRKACLVILKYLEEKWIFCCVVGDVVLENFRRVSTPPQSDHKD